MSRVEGRNSNHTLNEFVLGVQSRSSRCTHCPSILPQVRRSRASEADVREASLPPPAAAHLRLLRHLRARRVRLAPRLREFRIKRIHATYFLAGGCKSLRRGGRSPSGRRTRPTCTSAPSASRSSTRSASRRPSDSARSTRTSASEWNSLLCTALRK